MARGRMIDVSFWRSENVAALPPTGRLLLAGMITYADDQGRGKAHPALLRSLVFPFDDVALDDIRSWLELLHVNSTVTLYDVEGKSYYQLINWWEYQSLDYAAPSEHPAPCGWKDRIRKTVTKGFIGTYNWTLTSGEPVADTLDANGKPLQWQRQQGNQVNANGGSNGDRSGQQHNGQTPGQSGNGSPAQSGAQSPDDSPDGSPVQSPESSGESSPEPSGDRQYMYLTYESNYQLPTTVIPISADAEAGEPGEPAKDQVPKPDKQPKPSRPKKSKPENMTGDQAGETGQTWQDNQDARAPDAGKLTDQQVWFEQVCAVVGADYKTITKEMAGQIAQTIGKLRQAGYTLDELGRFMPDVWFKDWRWVKHQQTPTLTDLRNNIGRLRSQPSVAILAAQAQAAGANLTNTRQWDSRLTGLAVNDKEVTF